MIFTPRPYQRPAYSHVLNNPRSALWLGMGLGKTGVSLEAIATLGMLSEISNVLVVAPKRVARSTWPNEVAKWENFSHMRIEPIIGTPAQRKKAVKTKALIHTVNYENLPWLVKGWGADWPYDMVISDESTKLKSFRLGGKGGQRARALGKVAHKKVGYWLNLTGTPSPNGLIDLWGQSWFLDEGARLGRTYTSFLQRWFRQDYSGYGYEPLAHADEEIHGRLADLCLSMEAKDHFDLPDLVLNDIRVPLPDRARKLYQAMEREMFMVLAAEEVEAFNAASRTMKCLQLASGAAYLSDASWENVHDAKLEALQDVIEEAAGAPVLVAYHFRSDLARIKEKFPQAQELDDNPQTEKDWNDGKIQLLLAHPACLHPATEVLTEYRGWIRLIDVTREDRVFDGIEFVSHSGCTYSGTKRVIDLFGITMTPDHRLLIDGEWVEAADVRDIRGAEREARYTYQGNDGYLSEMLPLRDGGPNTPPERYTRQSETQKALPPLHRRDIPPDDRHPDLADLARHASTDDPRVRNQLRKLRRSWYRSVQRLVEVRKLLQGHGRNLRRHLDVRSDRQRERLFEGQLPMGDERAAASQQTEQPRVTVQGDGHAPVRILQNHRDKPWGNYPATEFRNDTGAGDTGLPELEISEEQKISKVYDLVDCGPRNRFLIRNARGEVFVSHNSAGHGLNLQYGGNILVFFSHWWDLEQYQQMIERIGPTRQAQAGLNRPVFVHHIVAENTVDELVSARRDTKRSVQDLLMEAMKRR